MGQLAFFIQFLKTGYRFEPWVEDCPLTYTSNNAPEKVDVPGSLFLSILSGHKRYAHIGTLTGDGVNSKLLGMNKVVSDDSARRGLLKIDEQEGVEWMQHHLQECYEPLLKIPWILDADVTIKTIYGSQEGAEKGYNPHKKGRPSHTYHSYMMANLKLILDVEVQPGDKGNHYCRRRLPIDPQMLEKENNKKKKEIAFIEDPENIKLFEYSVLVTSIDDGVVTIIDHYRNRANCENNFDEIKNQWGWGGYTTQDIKRCRIISRMVALIYNWWTLFVRLSNPDSHKESITSRPLLMSAIGKLTESGSQKKITLTSQHNLMQKIQKMQESLCDFF